MALPTGLVVRRSIAHQCFQDRGEANDAASGAAQGSSGGVFRQLWRWHALSRRCKGVYHALTTLVTKNAGLWVFGGAVWTFHLPQPFRKSIFIVTVCTPTSLLCEFYCANFD